MKGSTNTFKTLAVASLIATSIWTSAVYSASIEKITQANFSGNTALLEKYAQTSSTTYNAAYASWRLAGLYFSQGKRQQAIGSLNNGITRIELESDVESQALLATMLGFRIFLDQETYHDDGKKYAVIMDELEVTAPQNPRVIFFQGMGMLHTPEQYGGSATRAAALLEQSITLFEQQTPEADTISWGKPEAYIWASIAYAKSGNMQKAKEYREQAIKLNPALEWMPTDIK